MGIKTKVKDALYEESSWDLNFYCYENDNVTELNPSSVKVYIMLKDTADTPTYINGRDGTDATGVTVSTNNIDIHLDPDDNQIVGTGDFAEDRFEIHTLLVEVKYNADADRDFYEWELKIKNTRPIT